MVEQNIEVDKDDNRIGLRPRNDFYTGKYIHRASHLILFNSENEILIQKRAPTKEWYPNLYTYSVSGTVANESYEECMNKEMEEEIGLFIPVKYLFKYSFFDELDKAFNAVFVGKSDDEIKPDYKEMTEIKWVSVDELVKDLEKNPEKFTPPFREGMRIYFSEYYKTKE